MSIYALLVFGNNDYRKSVLLKTQIFIQIKVLTGPNVVDSSFSDRAHNADYPLKEEVSKQKLPCSHCYSTNHLSMTLVLLKKLIILTSYLFKRNSHSTRCTLVLGLTNLTL